MTIKKDPNLDTEWNDVLRAKGILPPKEEKEITEEDLIKMVESTIENKSKGIQIPLCKLLNQHLSNLAQKFPETKFLSSVSSLCIPNYPDKNLPTIFVYKEGEMKKQFVGPLAFGGINLKKDELEWMLSQTGAVNIDLEEALRGEVKDVMNIAIRDSQKNRRDDDDDDY
ncbi:LOW QUALITY PROTEIN: phosducin-like protein 3 [Dreissena polymorpha]|uniref:LOW QUALITY PROTEIN: phosducin-like protein 3 n=1 Tax=Dreissena polymorpha TaxID=45954 RepID=UPI002263EA57|nr:LOW QUALITY PROTEIN: phosducin-like protein 3 [Dreissena polymorpha]